VISSGFCKNELGGGKDDMKLLKFMQKCEMKFGLEVILDGLHTLEYLCNFRNFIEAVLKQMLLVHA
jgi:hypothetical protein